MWGKIWLQVENEPQREVSKVVKFAKVCTDTESSVVGLLSMGIVGVMSTLSFLWTMTSSTTICRISFRCSGVDVKGGVIWTGEAGVKDVQGGTVRSGAPGGDEHSGGGPSSRSAPGHGAQDAGVLGAGGLRAFYCNKQSSLSYGSIV